MTVFPVPLGRVLASLRLAVSQAETTDVLLRKTLSILNAAYPYESMIWVSFKQTQPDTFRAYSTKHCWDAFTRSCGQQISPDDDGTIDKVSSFPGLVQRFRPTTIPLWLVTLQDQPQIQCLDTGDLIIPICDDLPLNFSAQTEDEVSSDITDDPSVAQVVLSRRVAARSNSSDALPMGTLRFVLHIQHPNRGRVGTIPSQTAATVRSAPPWLGESVVGESSNEALLDEASSDIPRLYGLQNWPQDDVTALQTIGYHLLLAYDALALKRRLEQSQRHASLLSRTAHVLNTSVNLDRAMQGVLAEMGQTMRSDRLILFDLRQQSVTILATWERSRKRLASLSPDGLTYSLWQDIIDLFLQGGASHVEFRSTEPDADPFQAWLSISGVGSALLLPVFIREDFFGAIALLSSRHDRTYSLDELQMARQNTDQLSIALAMIQYSRASTLAAHPMATDQSRLAVASNVTHPFTDPITTLPNSEAFERALDNLSTPSVWAFRPRFSLIVCDVDYFKLVNDTHGVEVGDRVLQRIARKLQHQLRRDTPLYRYGGEEFAIILQDTDLQTARDVAERLRQAVRSMPLRTTSELLTVTLSFGVAQLQTEGDRHAIDVLKRAEHALFEAKRQGRDRVAIG